MNSKRVYYFLTFTLIMSMFFNDRGAGQSAVGKLQGKVTNATGGELLVGANVLLQNTQAGASSNIGGEYYILNIPPGSYTVRISLLGYRMQSVQDVRIVAGITHELNFTLTESPIDVGEMIIIAERPLFEANSTNTVKVYDSKEISQLPVKSVQKVLSLQAGVVSAEGSGGVDGNATINIRGGRGSEVLYVLDGVPQNDVFTGENRSQVSDNAIEQVAFQVGGYEAKYGQAQSGIVNITTKSGSAKYTAFGEVITSTLTDDFGYNQYSLNLGGPIIPGESRHTFFLSGERGWYQDATPSAIPIVIPSIGLDTKMLPNNTSAVRRASGKTYHNFDFLTLRLGANVNQRNYRSYTHSYVKNNSDHSPRNEELNQSYTARLSKDFSSNSFLNVNVGYKRYTRESGDGVWFNNFMGYGDTSINSDIRLQGSRLGRDNVGVFFLHGRTSNSYTYLKTGAIDIDADFFSQVDEHLLEIGGGISLDHVRYVTFGPVTFAATPNLPAEERFRNLGPTAYGYYMGSNGKLVETSDRQIDPLSGYDIGPRKPFIAYGYIQDRFELQDLVLNVGVRFDYFDSKAAILRDESLPYAFGDPTKFDAADFVKAPKEKHFSPRIGLGFPVTQSTVFHAQWGQFVQRPALEDVYTSSFDLEQLASDNNFGVNTGHVKSERTTQYEVGLRQMLGEGKAAINITAFYKNTEDLTNNTLRTYQRQAGGGGYIYYGPSNYDFGTVKGFAFTLDIRKISYFQASINYTYSIAEGTGSSTTSSQVATFRNNNPPGEVPVVIAPLDFDQRHTGTINVSFVTGNGELGILENTALMVLAAFASGRPYTPLLEQDLIAGSSNYGQTKGYVNTATGPGAFSMNLKLEKTIRTGNFSITPYFWVENLLGAENATSVYRSTGSPYTAAFMETAKGKAAAAASPAGAATYRSDYAAFERDPGNFGVPRQIRLGMKVGFN